MQNHATSRLQQLRPQIALAAQKVYDEWEQDEEGCDVMLGTGGICQDIAEAVCNVLTEAGIECGTVSQEVGEQHVYAVARTDDGVYSVDISPYRYERGGGYCWKKIPDVQFDASDVDLYRMSVDPEDFDRYMMDEGVKPAVRFSTFKLPKLSSLIEIADYHRGNYSDENTLYEFDEMEREVISRAVYDVVHGVKEETWVKIDFPRLVKIWNDYVKMGFVRDERGIDDIADRLVRNIAQLSANRKLIHYNAWKEEVDGYYCFKEPEPEPVEPGPDYVPPPPPDPPDPRQLKLKYRDQRGKFWSAYPPKEKVRKERPRHCEVQLDMTEDEFDERLTDYITMVSDFATDPLIRLALQTMEATDYEKKLVLCDNILNVIHANGDLASLFVDGGSNALSALSGEHTQALYHPYNWGSPFSTYTNDESARPLQEQLTRMKSLMKILS